jgi:hypothetical protein
VTFVHGSSTRVLANEKEVSSTIAGWTVTHTRAMSEVTVVGQTAGSAGARFVPGLTSGTLSVRGPQDSDVTTGLHKEIVDAVGVDNALIMTCLPDSDAVGRFALFTTGDVTDHAIDAAVSDAVGFTLAAQADEGVEMGYVLHPLAAETVDGNGTAVDRGATPLTPTTRGLKAVIHVTAYSGLTSLAVKVQHSTDNSVWADLATFASKTAVGSEMISVAIGTTVNRYLRVVTDVTGTGSATFLVAAAPR